MACWLFAVSEENWGVVREMNVFGVPERARRAVELVKPGDTLVFYVSKKNSKRLGGLIVGVYRVGSTWFREDKPLWPDEVREGLVKYPWRIRIEPIRLGAVPYVEVAGRLSFVGNKKRPHAYLVGTPANLRRPISENDVKVIIESMR